MAKDTKIRAKTQAWMDTIAAEFDLATHEKLLLQLCGEAWDNSRAAREAVQRDGAYQRSSRGALVPHPGLKQEIDASRAFAAHVKQLGLTGVPDPDAYAAMQKRRR